MGRSSFCTSQKPSRNQGEALSYASGTRGSGTEVMEAKGQVQAAAAEAAIRGPRLFLEFLTSADLSSLPPNALPKNSLPAAEAVAVRQSEARISVDLHLDRSAQFGRRQRV